MKYIIGVDEVGRGPIAGPVCVCVFASNPKNILKIIKNSQHELKDSKKLTKIKREAWNNYLIKCKNDGLCDFAVSIESSTVIDKQGIVKAIKKCINKSFLKLEKTFNISPKNSNILLDAGLTPPDRYDSYTALIKGDEREAVIAMASIVAKVHRDNIMTKYAKKYPDYGFNSNMGYGTAVHYIALKHKGILPIHRKTFL